MQRLNRYLFAPDSFHTCHEVYNYLQVQRRGFGFMGSNEDPDLHQMVLSSQRNVLNHLLHPNTLQRITNSRLYGNTYSVSEMMQDLTSGIFNADADRKSTRLNSSHVAISYAVFCLDNNI